jgi:hypothetical protein
LASPSLKKGGVSYFYTIILFIVMSISKAQALALADGYINSLGSQRLKEDELPVVEALLKLYGGEFIKQAQDNLEKSGSISSGNINDIKLQFTKFGNSYTLSLGYPTNEPASKYWKFVNKGVQGYGGKNAKPNNTNSQYKYKTPYPNRAMAASIFTWLNRARKSIRTDKYDVKLTTGRKKNLALRKLLSDADNKRKLAYAISSKIKRDGLKATHYFDNAAKETFGQNFYEVMTAALGKDIQIKIRQIGKELNNGNNNTK